MTKTTGSKIPQGGFITVLPHNFEIKTKLSKSGFSIERVHKKHDSLIKLNTKLFSKRKIN